ncbi:MAG: phosphotransferase family protein [Novosphingobium sp.]
MHGFAIFFQFRIVRAGWQINWWERVWNEDYVSDVPLVHVAINWLRKNLPAGDRLSIVHGDFRNGNFLFREADGEITAWLDWELAHIGDRHEDLAYLLQHSYGHYAEDGKTYLVCGLTDRADFLKRYEEATGLPVDPATLKFYEVLNLFKCAAITRGTSPRIMIGGKCHQDTVIAYAHAISYLLMEELRLVLEEVI